MTPNSKIASFFNALFVHLRHFEPVSKIERVVSRMKYSEKIFFYIATAVCIISSLILLVRVHRAFLVEIPTYGGSFTEGVVGSPRFINPVLAISDTDKDLVSLIYSGLLKYSPEGALIPNLAESYTMSEDGTVYDFLIRSDALFHDGKPVTADDVVFTILKALDPVIKSPRRASWEGVQIEKVNDKEIKFILGKPYAPFLSALTLGILPKHIWEEVSSEEFPFSEINIDPVGSGPYKVDKISRNGGGIPETISLSSYSKYSLGKPKINSITFKFFSNEMELSKAYEEEEIESMGGISPSLGKRINGNKNLVDDSSLPRVFGVFWNQNVAPVFVNHEVREALTIATPKQKIVDEVLHGFGQVLNGPTPKYIEEDEAARVGDIERAKLLLTNAGWTLNADGVLEKKSKSGTVALRFSITTSDSPELKQTAEILKTAWEELGAEVDIKVFEAGDLSQNIIRGRKYDALLFGEMIGGESDLYPFWHSSARNDPGLNISLYANIQTDKLLEEIQKETDVLVREEKKDKVAAEIKEDMPAIFLFSPKYLYMKSEKVQNISLKEISAGNERFLSIRDWYIETDKVWKFFSNS